MNKTQKLQADLELTQELVVELLKERDKEQASTAFWMREQGDAVRKMRELEWRYKERSDRLINASMKLAALRKKYKELQAHYFVATGRWVPPKRKK